MVHDIGLSQHLVKGTGMSVKSIALSYVTVTIYKMSKINKWQVCTLIPCELNVLGIKTMIFMDSKLSKNCPGSWWAIQA